MASNVNATIPNDGDPLLATPIRVNFQHIKTEIEALQSAPAGTGTVTSVATGTGLTGGPITTSGTLQLANTSVMPGTYQGLTVDQQGRITGASHQDFVTNVALAAALVSLDARLAALEAGAPPSSPPIITSSLIASGTVGQSFSYTITATHNPTSFNATSLPGGLTFTAPTISGTPTAPVTNHNIPITATNAHGSDTRNLVLTIEAAGPLTGWEVTYTFPVPPVTFTNITGRVALTSMTGWSSAFDADMTDALYDALTPADLPVNLYAKYSTDADFRLVDFDNWGGTAAANKITEWGYHAGTHSIYIIGSNSSGNPIQLRLIKH